MKLSQRQVVEQIGFNMTPMIDVVFLLIIFFMTVSQLNQNLLSPMQLPISNYGDVATAPATLVLNLDSEGHLVVNNEVIEREKIEEFLQQSLAPLDADRTAPHARLRCAADCSTTHVNLIFDILSKTGFESVTVAVRKQ